MGKTNAGEVLEAFERQQERQRAYLEVSKTQYKMSRLKKNPLVVAIQLVLLRKIVSRT